MGRFSFALIRHRNATAQLFSRNSTVAVDFNLTWDDTYLTEQVALHERETDMTTHTEQNIANVKRARTTKIARCRELISTRIGRKDPRGISELADLRTELAELLSRPIAA